MRIEELVICEGIVSICDDAFSGCSKLRTLVIPSSLEYVGKNCFFNTKLDTPQKVYCSLSKREMLVNSGIKNIAFKTCFCTGGKHYMSLRIYILIFTLSVSS